MMRRTATRTRRNESDRAPPLLRAKAKQPYTRHCRGGDFPMLVTRRQLIEGGIAAGAVAALSATPAFAGALDEAAYPPARGAARVIVDPRTAPAPPPRARASRARH